MTVQQQLEVIEKIREKIGSDSLGTCPVCDSGGWVPSGYFNFVEEIDPESLSSTRTGISTVALGCPRCGYLRFHSLDLLESDIPLPTKYRAQG